MEITTLPRTIVEIGVAIHWTNISDCLDIFISTIIVISSNAFKNGFSNTAPTSAIKQTELYKYEYFISGKL
jgi:hypothetical protein